MQIDHLKDYQRKIQSGEIERTAPVDPIEKSRQNPNSLRMAINGKCFDCCCGSRSEVKLCEITACTLHGVRPWQASG